MNRPILASTAIGLLAAPAGAHDFVLTPGLADDGRIAVTGLYGHPGSWDRPDLRRVIALDVHAPGKDSPVSILRSTEIAGSSALRLAASGDASKTPGATLVTATYDNGYWVRLGDDSYYSTTKKMVPEGSEITTSSHNIKFAKVLLTGDEPAGFDRATGQRLEIIPLAAPSALDPGGELRVRILFDGEPLADAEVGLTLIQDQIDEDTPVEKTDTDGIASLTIGTAGLQLIRTTHDTGPSEPDLADKDSFSSTFVIKIE